MATARELGKKILKVLDDRGGFDGWWGGIDRPIQREIEDAVGKVCLDEVEIARAKERARCLKYAQAMREGKIDDIRSVIFGITGGAEFGQDADE